MELAPSEFWAMTMKEFLLEVQIRVPEVEGVDTYAGGLTLGQLEELEAWANE